ncbi:MAG: prolyl oligopeptidase family serine peptidase [Bacillota bacterium]
MADKRRLVSEDLYKLVFVSDPQISPDGKKIAFVRSHIDEKTKEYRSHIYLVPTDGGPARQFTSGPKADTTPRWSPDGSKLAFISDRGSERQIHVMPVSGGEAVQVTKMRYGAGGPVWSPDGTKIAFNASVDMDDKPEDYEKPLDQKAKEAREKKRKEEPTLVTRLRVKSDMAMGLINPNRRNHIFVIDAEGKGPATDITPGEYDNGSPVWSPCGKSIAFTSNRRPDPDYEPWFADVWVVPAEGGEPRKVTKSEGPSGAPRWTPDGKFIIYGGHRMEHGGPTLTKLWKVPAEGGEPVCLTPNFDQSLGDRCAGDSKLGGGNNGPTLSPDGKTIYFLSSSEGRTSLYSVSVDGGDPCLVLGGDREIYGFTMDDSGKSVAMVVSEPTFPGDLYSVNLDTKAEKVLTASNKDLLEQVYIESPEIVPFKARDGLQEYGWIMKPAGFKEGVKYPAVLQIHGGPHSMYGYGFFFEFQLLINRGYAVIYSNPRGGEGFGQEFVKAVNGHYGEMDYDDLLVWTDVAIKHTGWIDENRIGVTGGSYGGFMTNWIVGHTDRYAAAVTQRSISNWTSFHGVSDIGYTFLDRELLIDLFKDFEQAWKFSPIAYVENVKTPLLIIHSEQDMRCPIEQGEQFYVALKKLKKEVEMARFPGSNHELSRSGKPVLRVARLNQILRWMDGHIAKNPGDYEPELV